MDWCWAVRLPLNSRYGLGHAWHADTSVGDRHRQQRTYHAKLSIVCVAECWYAKGHCHVRPATVRGYERACGLAESPTEDNNMMGA
jgi:hypothetical protein